MKKINNFLNNDSINKYDYILLSVILLVYGILSFINLGSMNCPNTFINISKGQELIITTNNNYISTIKYFNGENNSKFQIYTSINNINYKYIDTYIGNGSLSWQEEKIMKEAKYIKLLFIENSSLGELSLYNNSDEKITIKNITLNNKKVNSLTDEKNTIPNNISYMNSTYFDEIYFARTSYDYYKGLPTYEWTHPPLGKLIQATPIIITHHLSPFNYRLMGNIAGILLIALMYFYANLLFKKRRYSIFASLLLAFDNFHFTQSRLGTVDSFLVLFILASSYYMIKYIKTSNLKNLFLSGLFFSLSVSVKWTGLYGGVALCIIYFAYLIKEKHLFNYKYILYGISFFVILPLFIYNSLYLMFPNNKINYTSNIKNIIKQQEEMYEYHSKLETTHPFSSPWYTWPLSYKPVWYYTSSSNSSYSTISGLGNIIIWWMGIISTIYLIVKLIKKKDSTSFIIVVSILSLYIPYAFIDRVMFLYHYYPALLFVMLGIVSMFKDLEERYKKNLLEIYLVPVIIFFVIYYPSSSGLPVSRNYINNLRLLPSWIF